MADERDQSESDNPEREVGPEPPTDTSQLTGRAKYQQGSSSPVGGHPIGEFAHQGEAAMPNALDGGPDGTGNTGAELPGGATSEFARTSGGQTGGMHADPGGGAQGSPSGVTAQSPATVGAVGAPGNANEYGAEHEQEPLGADHQNSAKGGSVVSAGSGSTGPGPGQTGTDQDSGFIGSKSEDSDEAKDKGDAKQKPGAQTDANDTGNSSSF